MKQNNYQINLQPMDFKNLPKRELIKTESYAEIWNDHHAKLAEIDRRYRRGVITTTAVFVVLFAALLSFVIFSGYYDFMLRYFQ